MVFGDGAFFTMKIGKSETGRFGVLGRGRLKHYENRGLSARGARSLLEVLAVTIFGSQIGQFWQTREICTSGLSGGLQTQEICTSSLSGSLQTREICASGLSGGLQTREICTSGLTGGLQDSRNMHIQSAKRPPDSINMHIRPLRTLPDSIHMHVQPPRRPPDSRDVHIWPLRRPPDSRSMHIQWLPHSCSHTAVSRIPMCTRIVKDRVLVTSVASSLMFTY